MILVIKFCRLLSILDGKKMGEERMRENEGVCLFENKRVCPRTPTGLKSPVITGLFKDLSHSWQRNGNKTSLFNNKELTDFD